MDEDERRDLLDEGAQAAPLETARLATGCLWAAPISIALWAAILWVVVSVAQSFSGEEAW